MIDYILISGYYLRTCKCQANAGLAGRLGDIRTLGESPRDIGKLECAGVILLEK